MAKPRYLTKSLFKMAMECPTKLYYNEPDNGYFDKNRNNDFLQALADGGHQVGELAKYKYHPDPVGESITIETLIAQDAIALTDAMLSKPGRVVIAEAALLHEPYFVRVDILVKNEATRVIDLIEVKSKSVGSETVSSQFKNNKGNFYGTWLPYLYDVTFQAEVARLRFPGYTIRPKLLLIDSEQSADVDGLHQLFKIVEVQGQGRTRVQIQSPMQMTRDQLGSLEFLREVDVADIVSELKMLPIPNDSHVPEHSRKDLATFMAWAAQVRGQGERQFHGVSKTCRSCQFRAPAGDPQKSGVHECWSKALEQKRLLGDSTGTDRSTPLSIDLWGGGSGARSMAEYVLGQKRAFLADVTELDLPATKTKGDKVGMSAHERRLAQINAAKKKDESLKLCESRLEDMDQWQWPLHMIDFETSAPALPFFKGMRPYQTLAFQFSHHIMEKLDGGRIRVRHANQWISTKAGVFPSIEFVRQLRKALMPNGSLVGTVFRYHNHENTVLRSLRKTILRSGKGEIPDANDLIAFIDLITKSTSEEAKEHGEFAGPKAMVDLHRLVQEGYYSGHAGGSNSLKFMLPAVLHDAPGVAELYSRKSFYGVGLPIASLNFDGPEGHVWLDSSKGRDPYKTLPGIFGPGHGQLNDILARLAGDDDEDGTINQGGLAMTAYNYTQFNCLSEAERGSISNALLRYCELDTLAMVMLVQGLFELRGKKLTLDC